MGAAGLKAEERNDGGVGRRREEKRVAGQREQRRVNVLGAWMLKRGVETQSQKWQRRAV